MEQEIKFTAREIESLKWALGHSVFEDNTMIESLQRKILPAMKLYTFEEMWTALSKSSNQFAIRVPANVTSQDRLVNVEWNEQAIYSVSGETLKVLTYDSEISRYCFDCCVFNRAFERRLWVLFEYNQTALLNLGKDDLDIAKIIRTKNINP